MDYKFRNVSEALPFILSDLLEYGEEVGSRNGRVKELLNTRITLTHPWEREVLTTGRGVNIFAQIAETCWVLAGRNDVEWLSSYLPRAGDYADDGEHWRAGYGPRIRRWDTSPFGSRTAGPDPVDQLARVIDLLRKDPLTRQAVIQIWDVSDGSLEPLKDRACNTQLQFQSRLGELHLTVTVRSNDVMWGWSGINAFEWSTLQEIVASLLGIRIGTLTFNIGNLHLYGQHWKKAGNIVDNSVLAVHTGVPVRFNSADLITSLDEVDRLLDRWFIWEDLCRKGEATTELIDQWEEPMFQAWAAAIAYYWMRDESWLLYLRGTALGIAIPRTPSSVLPEPVQRPPVKPVAPSRAHTLSEPTVAFLEFALKLHATKHKSYGDSWKKRGEKMSILANIARKVDRLGVSDEFDSAADTWLDLWIYTAKYLCWLRDLPSDPYNVNPLLHYSLGDTEDMKPGEDGDLDSMVARWNDYMDHVDEFDLSRKHHYVRRLLLQAAPYARDLWLAEQDEYRGADND